MNNYLRVSKKKIVKGNVKKQEKNQTGTIHCRQKLIKHFSTLIRHDGGSINVQNDTQIDRQSLKQIEQRTDGRTDIHRITEQTINAASLKRMEHKLQTFSSCPLTCVPLSGFPVRTYVPIQEQHTKMVGKLMGKCLQKLRFLLPGNSNNSTMTAIFSYKWQLICT